MNIPEWMNEVLIMLSSRVGKTNLYQNLHVHGLWTWQHKISIPFTWRKIIPNSENQNGIGRFPDFSSPSAEWKVGLARLGVCVSHWTPPSSHNSAMEMAIECYHLSMPSPWPQCSVYWTSLRAACLHITRIKNIKNVTRCRDSRSAKSIETR